MAPRYSLEKVLLVALEGGDVLLGEARARRIVADYDDGYVDGLEFARAVVASLRAEHFQASVELADPPYRGWFDWYVTPLAPDLVARYGLEQVRTWYVKLKLLESDAGDCVVCVSLHPAERPGRKRRSS